MNDSAKLQTLADALSGMVYGGEQAWQFVPFKQFVADCRQAIRRGQPPYEGPTREAARADMTEAVQAPSPA